MVPSVVDCSCQGWLADSKDCRPSRRPLPQGALKCFQGGAYSALFVFSNLARSDTFLQCICRCYVLLLSLMSVHLINVTVAFISHLFFFLHIHPESLQGGICYVNWELPQVGCITGLHNDPLRLHPLSAAPGNTRQAGLTVPGGRKKNQKNQSN